MNEKGSVSSAAGDWTRASQRLRISGLTAPFLGQTMPARRSFAVPFCSGPMQFHSLEELWHIPIAAESFWVVCWRG